MSNELILLVLAAILTYVAFRVKKLVSKEKKGSRAGNRSSIVEPFKIDIDENDVSFPYADKQVLIHAVEQILLTYLEHFQYFLKNVLNLDAELRSAILIYPNWNDYKNSPEAENVALRCGLVKLVEHIHESHDHDFHFAIKDINLMYHVTLKMPSGVIQRVRCTITRAYGGLVLNLNLRHPFDASIYWSHITYDCIQKTVLSEDPLTKLPDILLMEKLSSEITAQIPNSSAEFLLDSSYRIAGTNGLRSDGEESLLAKSNYLSQTSTMPKKVLLVYLNFVSINLPTNNAENEPSKSVYAEVTCEGITKTSKNKPLTKVLTNKVFFKETFVFSCPNTKKLNQDIIVNFFIGSTNAAVIKKTLTKMSTNKTYMLNETMLSSADFMNTEFKTQIEVTSASLSAENSSYLISKFGVKENLAEKISTKKLKVKQTRSSEKSSKTSLASTNAANEEAERMLDENDEITEGLALTNDDKLNQKIMKLKQYKNNDDDDDDTSDSKKDFIAYNPANNLANPTNSSKDSMLNINLASKSGDLVAPKKKSKLKKLLGKFKSSTDIKTSQSLSKLSKGADKLSQPSQTSEGSNDLNRNDSKDSLIQVTGEQEVKPAKQRKSFKNPFKSKKKKDGADQAHLNALGNEQPGDEKALNLSKLLLPVNNADSDGAFSSSDAQNVSKKTGNSSMASDPMMFPTSQITKKPPENEPTKEKKTTGSIKRIFSSKKIPKAESYESVNDLDDQKSKSSAPGKNTDTSSPDSQHSKMKSNLSQSSLSINSQLSQGSVGSKSSTKKNRGSLKKLLGIKKKSSNNGDNASLGSQNIDNDAAKNSLNAQNDASKVPIEIPISSLNRVGSNVTENEQKLSKKTFSLSKKKKK